MTIIALAMPGRNKPRNAAGSSLLTTSTHDPKGQVLEQGTSHFFYLFSTGANCSKDSAHIVHDGSNGGTHGKLCSLHGHHGKIQTALDMVLAKYSFHEGSAECPNYSALRGPISASASASATATARAHDAARDMDTRVKSKTLFCMV